MAKQQSLTMTIQHLHDALADTEAVDACTAASLAQLTQDIERAVAEAQGEMPHNDFSTQLEQYALMFSEKHPLLSRALEEIIATLHRIGV